jgi:hypothetical protein
MKSNGIPRILGGIIGLVVGALVVGYLGLILGGTFLGSFDIHEMTGFEGYELSTYLGGLIGGIGGAVIGYRLALHKPYPSSK